LTGGDFDLVDEYGYGLIKLMEKQKLQHNIQSNYAFSIAGKCSCSPAPKTLSEFSFFMKYEIKSKRVSYLVHVKQTANYIAIAQYIKRFTLFSEKQKIMTVKK